MSSIGASLPDGFEALAPFVEFWAVDTAAERAHCRDISDEASRAAFYNAANDLFLRHWLISTQSRSVNLMRASSG